MLYINSIAVRVLELKRSTVSVSEGIRQNPDLQSLLPGIRIIFRILEHHHGPVIHAFQRIHIKPVDLPVLVPREYK